MIEQDPNGFNRRINEHIIVLNGGKCICETCGGRLGGTNDLSKHYKTGKHTRAVLALEQQLQPDDGVVQPPVEADELGLGAAQLQGPPSPAQEHGAGDQLPPLGGSAPRGWDSSADALPVGLGTSEGGPSGHSADVPGAGIPHQSDAEGAAFKDAGPMYSYVCTRRDHSRAVTVPQLQQAGAPVGTSSMAPPSGVVRAELDRRTGTTCGDSTESDVFCTGDVAHGTDPEQSTDTDMPFISDSEQLVRQVAPVCLSRVVVLTCLVVTVMVIRDVVRTLWDALLKWTRPYPCRVCPTRWTIVRQFLLPKQAGSVGVLKMGYFNCNRQHFEMGCRGSSSVRLKL